MAVIHNERAEGQIVNPGKDSSPTPYLQTGGVFSLADIALILDVPQSRLRNWSRGYKVLCQPRARSYSVDQVFLFLMLKDLRALGLTKATNELVLSEVVECYLPYVWLRFCSQDGKKWQLQETYRDGERTSVYDLEAMGCGKGQKTKQTGNV
jgi:hypothetical protein